MQLIVLSMHRSGSSVLARLLNMMGAYFSTEEQIMLASQGNPKGYWERRDVMKLNDSILEAGGGTWNDVIDFHCEKTSREKRDELTQEMARLLAGMDANRPWMMKDPRLCLTFPLWRELLEVPVCCMSYRNPLEIAQSLQRRNGFPLQVGVALWEAYQLAAIRNTKGLPRIWVGQRELLNDPVGVAARLHQELLNHGVHGLRMPGERELTVFIDSGLVHHAESNDVLSSYLNRDQMALWEAVQSNNCNAYEGDAVLSAGARDILKSYREWARETFELKAEVQDTRKKWFATSDWAEEHIRESNAKSVEIDRLGQLAQERQQAFDKLRKDIAGELTKRQELLTELNRLVEASYMSWRWRVGDFVVRIAERLLGRRQLMTAKQRIDQLLSLLRPDAEQALLQRDISAYIGSAGEVRGIENIKEAFTKEKQEELQRFLESGQELRLWGGAGRPQVSIILVLFNRAELTFSCLKSIREVVDPSYEVVIVDNASSDRTGELLQKISGSVKIVRNTENRNFLLACNQAAPLCEGEYLLFLNNDALLMPHSLKNALAVFDKEERVGAVGGKILLLDGTLQEAGSLVWNDGSCLGYGRGASPLLPEYMFRRAVDYCSGAFLLVPKRLHTALGGFDEAYVPAYYEETDFCLRLWEQGWRVIFEPSVQILHYEFASSSASSQAIALQQKNRVIFASKHSQYLEARHKPDLANVLQARSAEARKKILYIDDRIPHVRYGSGFPRSNFAVNALADHYDITLFPLNFPDEEEWSVVYTDIPATVEVMKGVGRAGFSQFLNERKQFFNLVLVSRPHNMEFYAEAHRGVFGTGPAPKIIYDAEAIFALRDVQKAALFGGARVDAEAAVKKEVELTALANKVIVVSENEGREFVRHGVPDVVVIGHAMKAMPTPRGFAERKGILFVGNMDYDDSPNVDSVLWFLEQVWPLLTRIEKDLELMLVGPNKAKRIRQLSVPGVCVIGSVDDLEPWYDQCRLFIAPTRYAGGIPYKVHEAASRGLPVVCTDLIRSQLGWKEPAVLSAPVENLSEFADKCLHLYTDLMQWQLVREAALERVKSECGASQVRETLLGTLADTLATA